jgi:hypothetical protein
MDPTTSPPLALDAPLAHYPVELRVRGRLTKFLIHALDVDTYTEFDLGWDRLNRITGQRRPIRLTEAEQAEQPLLRDGAPVLIQAGPDAGKPVMVFVIPDDVLIREQQASMTADETARLVARQDAEERWARKFTADMICSHVELEPGEVTVGGVSITSGASIVQAFRSEKALLGSLLMQIYVQNNLTADQKKAFGSLRAFGTSSGPSTEAAHGSAPATTAGPAEALGSAAPDDATSPARTSPAPPTTASSGGPATSSSPAAPSAD